MLAYHMTDFDNLDSIKSHVRANMPSSYKHVGSGIYVFFDKSMAADIFEYLQGGSEQFGVCVTVEVDEDKLLMDEDALIVQDEFDIEGLHDIMPAKAVAEYQRYLQHIMDQGGEDELPINSIIAGRFKIGLIDRYAIRPHPKWTINWGHYSVLTARCTDTVLKSQDVEVMCDCELYSLEEWQIMDIAEEL